jgi:hypothetical protein
MPKAHIRTFHQTEMIYRQVLQPELCSTPQLLASPEETNEEWATGSTAREVQTENTPTQASRTEISSFQPAYSKYTA